MVTHDDYLLALWYAPDPFFYNSGAWALYPWYRPRMCDGVFMCTPADTIRDAEQPRWRPTRRVDRSRTLSLGLSGGNYLGGYQSGGGYQDFGLGLTIGYRANEALGFEFSWQYHEEYWYEASHRSTQPFAGSLKVFAFPWAKVSPYASLGITMTQQEELRLAYTQNGDTVTQARSFLVGPHAGLGLEIAVGYQTSLSLEGRLIGYTSGRAETDLIPVAFLSRVGLSVYF